MPQSGANPINLLHFAEGVDGVPGGHFRQKRGKVQTPLQIASSCTMEVLSILSG